MGYKVAVVGATGVVGTEIIEILGELDFPVDELLPLASSRSAGKTIDFKGKSVTVVELTETSFEGVDFALFSAGGSISEKFVPHAVKAGALVIDNTSHYRMDKDVPLVVPQVNPDAIKNHKGIIANPNCSTAQLVLALKPLHEVGKIKRVVISTYQATSGAGKEAMDELMNQSADLLSGKDAKPEQFTKQIGFNLIPHIDVFMPNGYTKEEMKMIEETTKILEDDSIKVTATTVRVSVFISHSESVNVETEKKITPEVARDIFSKMPGVEVMDDPANNVYPTPIEAAGKNETFIGRIREDLSVDNGLEMFIVSDNLRRGAALNAVEIGLKAIELGIK